MPDIDTVRGDESQDRFLVAQPQVAAKSQSVARAPRVSEQPSERLVQVRLSLLRDLQNLQKNLDAHIAGYICSREMDEQCQQIGSRLELGTKDTWRLGDPVYWTDIRDGITRVFKIVIGLPPLICSDFKEQVEDFEKNRENVSRITAGPAHSPTGANVINIASEALRSIELMRERLMHITVQSKQKADSALAEIKNVIKRIFDLIEATPEVPASESSRPLVAVEARKPEAIEREKPTSGWAERGATRPETTDYARR